jgi:hypothetical protein
MDFHDGAPPTWYAAVVRERKVKSRKLFILCQWVAFLGC